MRYSFFIIDSGGINGCSYSKNYFGDCREALQELRENSVDLIFTSPPYADQRSQTYGGIKPEQYVDWFMPIATELLRVLKPDGTFVLNIKEKAQNGERHTYVLELILAMRKIGWLWTEEMIWHKKNCYPGKWPNRFRDSWERLLQFNKSRHFNMYQEEVMVPMGSWAEKRLQNLSETDKIRDNSKVGRGFGKNISNWIGKEKAYPTNVLQLATECANKNHSAAFPESLPEWFINKTVYNGNKSAAEGIDLEFDADGVKYIVSIKSGPNWGNSSQIKKMKDNFNKAKRILRTSHSTMNIIAVNGCCYGKNTKPDKGEYQKLGDVPMLLT